MKASHVNQDHTLSDSHSTSSTAVGSSGDSVVCSSLDLSQHTSNASTAPQGGTSSSLGSPANKLTELTEVLDMHTKLDRALQLLERGSSAIDRLVGTIERIQDLIVTEAHKNAHD